jgi:hypothetical protein
LCVEIGDGILVSDTDENPDENPTEAEAARFQSEILELEKWSFIGLKT